MTSSPALSTVSPRGHDQPVAADHRHDGGVPGDVEIDQRRSPPPASPRPGSPRPGGRCPASNCSRRTSDPTDTASSTRAVSSWGVDTETSTPQDSLNSHWLLGVVDPGHDAGNGEFLFGEQRDDQVVLVVAGGGHRHVDVGHARPASSELTSQASAATQVTSSGGPQALHEVGVLLDQQDVVAVGAGGPWRWRSPRCRLRRWPPSLSPATFDARRRHGGRRWRICCSSSPRRP